MYGYHVEILKDPVFMLFPYQPMTANSIQECVDDCVDEIDEALDLLERFPPPIVAAALGVHLKALLGSMMVCHICSKEEALELIDKIRRDLLEDMAEIII
jgi:enoyl-CoA hydratase/carnithine racemase